MKKVFSNIFGGKKEKDKDKTLEVAGEDRRQQTASDQQPGQAAPSQQPQKHPEQKQQKQQTADECSSQPDSLQQQQQQQKHQRQGTANELGTSVQPLPQQQQQQQQQLQKQLQQQQVELNAERHQWQQKIASLQNTILELEAALEATRARPPPPSERELAVAGSACPACGHPASPAGQDGDPGPDAPRTAAPSEASVPAPGEAAAPTPAEQVDLSSEIARLASVQQQLEQSPRQLAARARPERPASLPSPPPEALACAETQTDEWAADSLSRNLQEMSEKLEVMKKSNEALEEQRNELEEAENDARLMVQRLEVKVFTAGEVEKMLSTDLSEEQERCRQLQRQLNSLRLKHQAELRARQAEPPPTERVSALEQELAELRAELRRARAANAAAAAAAAAEPAAVDELARSAGSSPLPADKSSCFSDSGVGEELSHASDLAAASPAGSAGTLPAPADAAAADTDDEPARCSVCSRQLSCLSTTASPGNSLLFGGAEQERLLAAGLRGLQAQQEEPLDDAELRRAVAAVLRDQAVGDAAPDQAARLERELAAAAEERARLVNEHELGAQALQEQQAELQRRLRSAEATLTTLSTELELAAPAEDAEHLALVRKVQETRRSEAQLAAQVSELEKKEGAYRETLEEADRIMHSVELRYQKNIEELEDQLRESKNRINFMEGTEEKLKQALYSSSGKRDQQRVAELLDKLIETENEDLKLKEKVYRLERREREQSIRLREEERAAERLRLELRDQEELLRELDAARRQLAAGSEQLAALEAQRQRAAELQLSEQQLRGRCEELEQAELGLQETLRSLRAKHADRERRLSEQVDSRQRELESLQAALLELQLQEVANTEERAQLRRELQEARRYGERLEAAGGDADPTETQHRSEVEKLRHQLSLVNQQMTEKETYCCQLQEQLEKLQGDHAELRQATESQKARSEQEIFQLNLELSRREEEVNAVSTQLKELNKTQMTRELDVLADHENNLIKLLALVKATNRKIQGCDSCRHTADGVLSSVVVSLEQVILLISGAPADQSLQAQLRDAEALAAAAARLSARPPGVSTGVQTAPPEPDPELAELRLALELRQRELAMADGRAAQLREQLEARGREQLQLRGQLEQQRLQRRRQAQQAQQAAGRDRLLGALLRRLGGLLTAEQTARLVSELRDGGSEDHVRQGLDREAFCQALEQSTAKTQESNPILRTRSLTSVEDPSSSKLSRIPRLLHKAADTAHPPASSRKVTPPSRVPLPRRTHSARGATVAPPVGVARPYRSAAACEWSPPREPAPEPAAPPPALPPPDSFQIIRAVGGDSLLLYWSPVEDKRIAGYQIFVDNELQLAIRNPQRTKALLPALDLSDPMRLGIRAVSAGDSYSAVAWAEYRPDQAAAAQ